MALALPFNTLPRVEAAATLHGQVEDAEVEVFQYPTTGRGCCNTAAVEYLRGLLTFQYPTTGRGCCNCSGAAGSTPA